MTNKKWYQTQFTYVWVFNTGRGLSVCIRLPHNIGILYDLGSESDGFSPADFVAKNIRPKLTAYNGKKIAQVVLSHPHADHIREVDQIIEEDDKEKPPLYPELITCPSDAGDDINHKVDFKRIRHKDGSNKDLIDTYQKAYAGRKPPLQTIKSDSSATVPNVRYGLYYMRPPEVSKIHDKNDQHYGNGLSLVLYLRHGKQNILIPGDITPEVHKEVLKSGSKIEKRFTYFCNVPNGVSSTSHEKNGNQPILEAVLRKKGLSVLVAPHHGLESCYSQELFSAIKDNKPQINIISERRHLGEKDGKVDDRYRGKSNAKGVTVDIEGKKEKRYSVSTASGKHILAVFKGTDGAPHVYLREKPEDLMGIVP